MMENQTAKDLIKAAHQKPKDLLFKGAPEGNQNAAKDGTPDENSYEGISAKASVSSADAKKATDGANRKGSKSANKKAELLNTTAAIDNTKAAQQAKSEGKAKEAKEHEDRSAEHARTAQMHSKRQE